MHAPQTCSCCAPDSQVQFFMVKEDANHSVRPRMTSNSWCGWKASRSMPCPLRSCSSPATARALHCPSYALWGSSAWLRGFSWGGAWVHAKEPLLVNVILVRQAAGSHPERTEAAAADAQG